MPIQMHIIPTAEVNTAKAIWREVSKQLTAKHAMAEMELWLSSVEVFPSLTKANQVRQGKLVDSQAVATVTSEEINKIVDYMSDIERKLAARFEAVYDPEKTTRVVLFVLLDEDNKAHIGAWTQADPWLAQKGQVLVEIIFPLWKRVRFEEGGRFRLVEEAESQRYIPLTIQHYITTPGGKAEEVSTEPPVVTWSGDMGTFVGCIKF